MEALIHTFSSILDAGYLLQGCRELEKETISDSNEKGKRSKVHFVRLKCLLQMHWNSRKEQIFRYNSRDCLQLPFKRSWNMWLILKKMIEPVMTK